MTISAIMKRIKMAEMKAAVPASTYLQTHTDLGPVSLAFLKNYTFDETAPEPGKDAIYHLAVLELKHPS